MVVSHLVKKYQMTISLEHVIRLTFTLILGTCCQQQANHINSIHTADAMPTRLNWVASAVCIEFVTSSWRLPTKVWKLNMMRIYPVVLSRVKLCRRCVHARRLSWPSLNSAAYMWLAQKIGNWVTTDDWCVHTADTTRLRCQRIVQTRQYCRQLVAIHTADATQLDSFASALVVCIGL